MTDQPADNSSSYETNGENTEEQPRRKLASFHRTRHSHHSGSHSHSSDHYSHSHHHDSYDRSSDGNSYDEDRHHHSSHRSHDEYGRSSDEPRYGDEYHQRRSHSSEQSQGSRSSHGQDYHHSADEQNWDDIRPVKPETVHTQVVGSTANLEMVRMPLDRAEYEGPAYADGRTAEMSKVRQEDVFYADTDASTVRKSDAGNLASTIAAASAVNPHKTYDASQIKSSASRLRKKKRKKRRTFLGILTGILVTLIILILAGIGGLIYMRARGEKQMSKAAEEVSLTMQEDNTPEEVEEIEDDGKTITYKGQKYRWNENVSTILFLGSDRTIEQQEKMESVIGINGQADTILLGVIDNTNKKVSFININRDTLANVAQYTPDGDYAGEKKMQICLAYSYGKNNEQSCERMIEAVSNFMYGIPIHSYARISYDAIPMLNDSVGGVTVTIKEDMTGVDPSFVKDAQVTLVGNQALQYIRWRNHSVTETNELRMARQKQYFYGFVHKTLEATRADLTLPIGLYNNARPYMTTSITPSQVTYLTSKVLEYGIADGAIRSVPGESFDGENGLVEFHADDTRLYEIILENFYNKVDK